MIYNAEEKYQGMLRAFESLQEMATNIGQKAVVGDPSARDAVNSFFNECYHLKDWLKKDPRITRRSDVEQFINRSRGLKFAADLCNSMKHAGLKDPPRSGMYLDQINMAYSLDIPRIGESGLIEGTRAPSDGDTITISTSNRTGRPIATAKVVLTIGGTKHDALDIASECVQEWDTFLATQGIQFSKS